MERDHCDGYGSHTDNCDSPYSAEGKGKNPATDEGKILIGCRKGKKKRGSLPRRYSEGRDGMKRAYGIIEIIILLILTTACGKNTAERWQEQYDLGMRYLEEENYEEAIVAFTAAIEIDPNYADAYTGRGNAYIFSGETDEHLAQALSDYQKALELDEENTAAYLGIADIYIRQGNYEDALEILNEGLEKTGGNEEIAAKIAEIESGNITDSSGNVRRRNGYDASGALIWFHEFTYSADGKQSSITSFDMNGNQTGHVDLAYDEEGLPFVSYVYYYEDGAVGKIVYERDSAGQIVKEETYDAQGELGGYCINEYDTVGNMIRQENYTSDGELEGTEEYEYNGQGQRIRRSYYDIDGTLSWYDTYEYDSDGHRKRYDNYDSDGQLSWYQIDLYDEAGNWIGYEEYDGDGNLTRTVTNE